MIGLLEAERERAEVGKMSLEYAYNLAKSGKLRFTMWAWAAMACPCECGGPQDTGFNCVQDNHAAMRTELKGGNIDVATIQA